MIHARYRNVDGVVIASVDFHDPQVIELVNSEIPTVTIDYVYNNSTAIMSDNSNGLEALVKYAASLGHKKIAFIHGSFRGEAAYQILATRWDILPSENGNPFNRQFYILEDGKEIFYSALVDENTSEAKCIHSPNKTTIKYLSHEWVNF